jgi:hypothetical protein
MQWGKIVEQFMSAAGLNERQMAGIEKRRSLRIDSGFGIVGHRSDGENIPFMVRNCGLSGLRVESPHRLRKGEVLILSLPGRLDDRESPTAPRARVVWSRKQRNLLGHDVGLTFVIENPDHSRRVAHFLIDDCRIGIGNPTEKRRAPRVPTEVAVVFTTREGEMVDALARDLAVGGVLALTDRPIERHLDVAVRVTLPDGSGDLAFSGRVVRCVERRRHEWEVGVVFTRVPDGHKERLVTCLSRLLHADRP